MFLQAKQLYNKPLRQEDNARICSKKKSSKLSSFQNRNSSTKKYVDNTTHNSNNRCKELGLNFGDLGKNCVKSLSSTDFEIKEQLIKKVKPSKIPLYSSMTLGSKIDKKLTVTSEERTDELVEGKTSVDNSLKRQLYVRNIKQKMPAFTTNYTTVLPDRIFLKLNSLEKTKNGSKEIHHTKLNIASTSNSTIHKSYSGTLITHPNQCDLHKNEICEYDRAAIKELQLKPESESELGHSVPSNIQILVGEINKNSNRASILNSRNNLPIRDDDTNTTGEIRTRNLRSTLLGWLKT